MKYNDDRKYYTDVYNKLVEIAEQYMLRRFSDDGYKAAIEAMYSYVKQLHRENKISKSMYNELIKLIKSYENI